MHSAGKFRHCVFRGGLHVLGQVQGRTAVVVSRRHADLSNNGLGLVLWRKSRKLIMTEGKKAVWSVCTFALMRLITIFSSPVGSEAG